MSSLQSAQRTDEAHDELRRRFVEASRRAEVVTIVNLARSEARLGELVTAELCEVFEAEIAFVVASHDGAPLKIIGSYGLGRDDQTQLLADALVTDAFAKPGAEQHRRGSLLSVGARDLVLVPFVVATGGRGVVGVARLYDEPLDEAEVALLEAVTRSVGDALERIWLGEEREMLLARERDARHEAEERARAARILAYVADGVALVDPHGVVTFWNPAAEAITGLPSDRIVGHPIDELIRGWDALASTSSAGGRAVTVPLEIDGREVWLSVTAVGFGDGTVYAFRDLTEEHDLEVLKADFIATVSHELRTPLSAVHGAAKTLQRRDVTLDDEVRDRLLAVISEQGDRLAQLVEDVLLASQIDSHQLVLAADEVDAYEVAWGVVVAARTHAPPTVELDVVAVPPVPPVAADVAKLRQVLANLISNAIKYSPDGGRIEARLEPVDGKVRFVVSDEGIGIPAHEQERIFEKFYRVDPHMTRGVSGTGLGLYICRELIQRMHGTIWVESRRGGGSSFFVELPRARQS